LVEVTVTSTSSSSNNNDSNNNNNEEEHPSSRLPKTSARETEEVMLSLNEEIRLHFRHASYEDALTVASKLLTMTTEHFGTLHPATASAYNNVGLMNKSLGRYDNAKEAYHESLRIYGEVCGKDHASYAAALSNLGMLERGRAMESEGASSSESSDDVDESQIDSSINESTNKTEKKRMSAMERMRLNDSAIEYLDESYRIRLAELGPDHPHTVSSRSQLGAAMAASVITERRGLLSGLVEAELRKLKHIKNVRNSSDMETYVPEAIAKAASGATSSSRLTKRRWEAAEEHLRGALDTAVRNPRGESVQPLMYISLGSSNGNDDAGSGNNASSKSTGSKGLILPSRRESKEGMSKKEKKKLGKEKIRDKRRANAMALRGGVGNESSDDANDDESDNNDDSVVDGGKDKLLMSVKVTTLSAATSAQNLAVFLKNYSDWTRLSLLDEKGDTTQRREGLNQTVQEARHLYESALHVRSSILPPHHPDVIATKFSLAELLDSPLAMARTGTTVAMAGPVGLDSVRANQLREEILNSYNVEEREEDKDLSA
jgi:tetratricopeptide (TPR) repeat protein